MPLAALSAFQLLETHCNFTAKCNQAKRRARLTQIPKFGVVLVLVVVLVLGALGFRDRKQTDVLQLICSVSLICEE